MSPAIEAEGRASAATAARAQYRRGALLVAGGALAWSISGLIVRTTSTDAWSTLFWRSVFACLFLFAYVALRDRGRAIAGFRKLGLPGLGVAVSFAISMGCFILALNEIYGDMLSAVMGISFAVMVVLARRHRDVPMTAATCLATALTGLVALPFATLSVTPGDLALLALFGVGQMGLGLIMFTAGVRLIPAADAGLITVLEVIAAPIWVWLAFGENPGLRAIIGGSIVLAAVVFHTLLEKRE